MRYLYFFLRYFSWFKNPNGIKAFSEQSLGWILRSAFALARRLERKNTKLKGKITASRELLEKNSQHPVIDADEYHAIRRKLRWLTLVIVVCALGESFFNYFAGYAIFTFSGTLGIVARVFFALFLTFAAIIVFEQLISELLNEAPYKGFEPGSRNWGKIIGLLVVAILFEALLYNITKLRGYQIEGVSGDGIISTAMLLAAMLMPILAGYAAYEKSHYINAYRNTNLIERLERRIRVCNKKIAENQQRMDNAFRKKLIREWSILQEFATYKQNYAAKRQLPEESTAGHFCNTENSFRAEAIKRYTDQALFTGTGMLPSVQNFILHSATPQVKLLQDFTI